MCLDGEIELEDELSMVLGAGIGFFPKPCDKVGERTLAEGLFSAWWERDNLLAEGMRGFSRELMEPKDLSHERRDCWDPKTNFGGRGSGFILSDRVGSYGLVEPQLSSSSM